MSTTIKVEFSDVHSIQDFKAPDKKPDFYSKMNHPGVYIWGFVFEKDDKGNPIGSPLTGDTPFSPHSHLFIPYYVGQSGSSIYDCFDRRHGKGTKISPLNKYTILSDPLNKYTVLSDEYLKVFYKDSSFPEVIGVGSNVSRDWYLHPKKTNYFKGKIIYINNHYILDDLYHPFLTSFTEKPKTAKGRNPDYPKDDLINALKPIKPALASKIDAYINAFFSKMYFCFTTSPVQEANITTSQLESYIFYRLKGKTVSKHNYEFLGLAERFINHSVKIKITPGLDIFKPRICPVFPGYQNP